MILSNKPKAASESRSESQPTGLADLERPNVGREAVAAFAIVGVFLAGLIGWASVAPGVVSIDGYRKTVQHLEGGIVDEILVREGALVAAGGQGRLPRFGARQVGRGLRGAAPSTPFPAPPPHRDAAPGVRRRIRRAAEGVVPAGSGDRAG